MSIGHNCGDVGLLYKYTMEIKDWLSNTPQTVVYDNGKLFGSLNLVACSRTNPNLWKKGLTWLTWDITAKIFVYKQP